MSSSRDSGRSLQKHLGYQLEAPGHETLCLVGDTSWRDEVDQTLKQFGPEVVVINAGYATMNDFDGSIIMGKEDVLRAANAAPNARIVATHMDAINHMAQTRGELRQFVQKNGVADRVEVPEDGDTVRF
jgi:L-ascorbate metabolism protein UlaG (beta-lactamase superfamily)